MSQIGPISGTQGAVNIALTAFGYAHGTPFVVGLLSRWNADIRRDVGPNETFDTSDNFKRKIGGMYDIAGTCEGWLDAVVPFTLTNIVAADYVATEGADNIELVVRQGTTNLAYKFDAILSNINMQVVKGSDLNRFALSFESTGAIVATLHT